MPSHATRPVIAQVLHRLDYAGAEVLAADLARRLKDRFEFAFVCLDGIGPLGEQLRQEGFAVHDLGRKPGLDRRVADRLGQWRRGAAVAVFHAHQYTPFFYSAWSRGIWGNLTGRPRILFTEHGRHYPDRRQPRRVTFNRMTLRSGDRVTAVGQFIKEALVRNEGIAAGRIEVIHNGVDLERFPPRPETPAVRARIRRELELPDEALVVLQVARFHPVKDHATALAAFALAAENHPTAVLLLAGDGPQRQAMQDRAMELRIASRVRFLGLRTDIPALMAAADLFSLSSVSEGVSVTLLEAMAAQLAIVATDVGGNAEVVEHDVSGLLSPRGDAEALGRNMAQLLSDPTRRDAMAHAGRQRVVQQFTQARMHQCYASLYDVLSE